jgi:hypothetical protein
VVALEGGWVWQIVVYAPNNFIRMKVLIPLMGNEFGSGF